MSHHPSAYRRPTNGHAADPRAARGDQHPGGPHHPGRPVDWSGYPALFQRVGSAVRPNASMPVPTFEPTPAAEAAAASVTRGCDVRQAFLGFAQALLFPPAHDHFRIDRPSEAAAAAKAVAAAEAFGFTAEELRRAGGGLYAGPAAVRDHLRSLGFGDAEIDAARLACDASGRPWTEFAGCLVLPLADEIGRVCDFLFVTPAGSGRGFASERCLYGAAESGVVAYGLQAALSRPSGRTDLVLVEDVCDGLLLQCRGLHRVAAVGGRGGDLSPRRWEELARLGVTTVTLAFRRDARHTAAVRDALVHALRARTAPAVFVADPYPAGEPCAADVLRRFGGESCAASFAARSLAFHDKDFGAEGRTRPAAPAFVRPAPPVAPAPAPEPPKPAPVVAAPAEPHHRIAFRKHAGELAAALPAEDRAVADRLVAAFDAAVCGGEFAQAAWLVEGGLFPWEAFGPTPCKGWASEARTACVSTAAQVLDRLADSPEAGEVPAHLDGFGPREATHRVEWVFEPTARGRLAVLCERLIDACERKPAASFVVVCREHSERQTLLALATHLAGRLSDGQGLTIDEVRARLAGTEPAGGFRDKPWLADEAADRLRLWSRRLTFVTCPPTPAGRAAVESAIETARRAGPLGGIWIDGVAAPEFAWPSAWGHEADSCGGSWLADLAARCGCPVTACAATPPGARPWHPSADRQTSPLLRTDGGRAVLSVLRDWLRRETEAA